MRVPTAQLRSHPPRRVLDQVDLFRLEATKLLKPETRGELGQYLTPSPVARFMAALFNDFGPSVRLLDAGAGVGTLLAAVVSEACARREPPARVKLTAFEIDETLGRYLDGTVKACEVESREARTKVQAEVVRRDFIAAGVEMLDEGLFGAKPSPRFTHAILNPPYKKLSSDSETRRWLRCVGVETSNLYTAFVALAIRLLEPGGEMVAITPRSFCNGPYFRPFRELLLGETAITRVHLFESRTAAFSDDDVLQENVIFHLVKRRPQGRVVVSSSASPDDDMLTVREVPFEQIVKPTDPERFFHLVPDDLGQGVADAFSALPSTLKDLGLAVSTGKVVDFRAKPFLRAEPAHNTKPLIYPTHFAEGVVVWPKQSKKPNALVDHADTSGLWMPSGTYVLVKRFSSKEERRRVVAAVLDPTRVKADKIGFENHLNVFHVRGSGLDVDLAWGLATFLNSTLVDTNFRQFNGHTQVNATDLRSLRYPPLSALRTIGKRVERRLLPQQELDVLVQEVLGLSLVETPLARKQKIEDALGILKVIGLPRQQQDERSALTLLALVGVTPSTRWGSACAPLMGLTPILEFIAKHYERTQAPNTRETVRRQTIHQFLDAGLIVANPEAPSLPANSPKSVYQVDARTLDFVRSFGTVKYDRPLAS